MIHHRETEDAEGAQSISNLRFQIPNLKFEIPILRVISASSVSLWLNSSHSTLKRMLMAALLVLCLLCVARAQQATYRNPVIAGDYPDPSVVRVGEEFWAATTTGGWAPHFALLRSRDLVNWEKVGYVFQTKPAWAKGDFWAPEIVSDGGRFLVFYTARRDEGPKKRGTLCVGVADAAAPSGPYTDHGPLTCQIPERGGVGSIDAGFVRDEHGDPYLVWKADGNDAEPDEPTSIYAQRLSDDATKLLGKRKEILRNNVSSWEGHVTEGSYILRHGEWFYHFYSGNACCGRACNYALGVARSRKLLGPWEKYGKNPIIAANRDWQCPGHGSIVETADGRDFLLYHSYRQRRDTFNIGREAVLDEVTWGADGWPAINGGRGPSSVAPAPLGVAGKDSSEAEFFDGFTGAKLNPEWQWPLVNQQTASIELTGGSFLRLMPQNVASSQNGEPVDEFAAAVVARRTTWGDYVATTLVSTRGMAATARAGLSVYGWRGWSVGIATGGGKVSVWRREGEDMKKDLKLVAVSDAPKSDAVFLRMIAEGGELYRFAFSTNGRDWTELGGAVDGGYIEGARVALTAGGGVARFDWVKVRDKK
ncbi:MAG: xylan 1,4-beta-xylosidase [Acidobacteriota bacterium]|nr:xylan 1,4-beta-xylosidase [Acidobacteriota bacterium]